VGPRAGLDAVEMRKFLTLPDSNSDSSVVQPVGSGYTDCAIPAHQHEEILAIITTVIIIEW
jgi:hypothetical protein